tara:strand:+ start:212 stop:1138 length:927 start_codon:yes stop_codon:yes gene_type:complete
MIKCNLKLYSHIELFNNFVSLNLQEKLPLRILLTGDEGIGKSTFALHFINYLFSAKEMTKYDLLNHTINSSSISFNHVNNLSHPNFYLIKKNDDKKSIEVDQIRQMTVFLNKSTLNNDKKIILIDGVEHLSLSAANALLKNLEESNLQNLFILIHNNNKNIIDTIKSRCLSYRLNFNFSDIENIIEDYFGENLYLKLSDDFKILSLSPNFIVNHINFFIENKIDMNTYNVEDTIKFIINKKLYKTNYFIKNNFQIYIEIYFSKMYLNTKDNKYYSSFIEIVTETNLINKFNLDFESFIIKLENKYLKI